MMTPAMLWIGSIRTAATLSSRTASAAARSPKGTRRCPGTLGLPNSRYFASPAAEMASAVRPWKPPSKERTSVRRVKRRARRIAFSLASVPELTKKTFDSGAGACAAMASAARARTGSATTFE